MKPYGRKDEPIKGGNDWKKDYHCHDKNHRKIGSWWEEMSEDYIDRGAIKQRTKKQLEKDIEDNEESNEN